MASTFDVDKNKLIEKIAEELKKNDNITPPEWATWVKTGINRQRPPAKDDWWYSRAAAVLCSIEKLGPIGVSKLRTKYGGRQRRGHKPPHFKRSGGNIIRKVLQQLEKAELIKHTKVKNHKGRVIAPKGKSLLDKTATIMRGPAVKKPKVKAEVKEVKKGPKKQPAKKAGAPKEKAVKPKREKKAPVKIEVKPEITNESIKKADELVKKVEKEQPKDKQNG